MCLCNRIASKRPNKFINLTVYRTDKISYRGIR